MAVPIAVHGLLCFILVFAISVDCSDLYDTPWTYACEGGFCKKRFLPENTSEPITLPVCQLSCGQYGALWPQPTGHVSIGSLIVSINPQDINLTIPDPYSSSQKLLMENFNLFKNDIPHININTRNSSALVIRLADSFKYNKAQFTLTMDEKYTLQIAYQPDDKIVNVTISANSYFGARHAMETLSQLIVYDNLQNRVKMTGDVYIEDGPVYPYRGILLDTARNFIDPTSILRTIKAMSMSKMNTFHWHITDSHSFPYVSKTWPNMSKYGAYDVEKIYSEEDVKHIVNYGLINGIRVLPEFDAPAHVGEGWQWVGNNSVLCFKAEPWQNYCVEPPCGQLNPTSEKVYEILEGIYKDMIADFQPDLFHMGGDEVNLNCWKSSEEIKSWMTSRNWKQSDASYYRLWNYFQEKALEKLMIANNGKPLRAILWTSGLTNEENIAYLDPNKYIIQIWTTGNDPTIDRLLKKDFKVIFSNYDALYLDCGYGAWVGTGNNWCSPYKGWQLVYENSPKAMLERKGLIDKKNLVLGAEAALWSEQVDSASVQSKLWPRSAALAERLWAEPVSSWTHAEQRLLRHRERLVGRGILADSLEPEWCLRNQGHCYL